jgi:hypothetical protein
LIRAVALPGRDAEVRLTDRPGSAIRQAGVGTAKTMIEGTRERFALKPERLAAR